MNLQSWAVSEAKAHLPEILRRARTKGPQQIGKRNPCVVVSADEWERLMGNKPHLGRWLISSLADSGELDVSSRSDG